VADFDIHAVFQVGDRSAHLQNFIVGAGGKAKPFDRDFQQVLRFVVDLAEMTDIPCFQVRVAVNLFPLFITLKLPITRLVDASADRGRGFARLGRLQFVVFQGRHFNVNVDAVEERSGQFRPVVLDLQRRAPAFMVGIGEIAAGALVHCNFFTKPKIQISINRPKFHPKGYPFRPKTIGRKIRKHRIDLGLYQKDLGVILGVSTDTITYWEKGRVNPGKKNIVKIQDFLNGNKIYPINIKENI